MNFNSRNNPFGRGDSSLDILNLEKGDILDLTKVSASLEQVVCAAKWEINESGKDTYDLDISAFMLDENGRIKKKNALNRVVFFNQLAQVGIYLEGDNLTGGSEDDADDERIVVDLNKIPDDVQSIVFHVNIFDAYKKKQTFGSIKSSIRLLDCNNNEKELCRFSLNDHAAGATALCFARLFRNANGRGWSFEAIGESLVVANLNEILVRYIVE